MGNNVEIPICAVCGQTIDEQEGPLCEVCNEGAEANDALDDTAVNVDDGEELVCKRCGSPLIIFAHEVQFCEGIKSGVSVEMQENWEPCDEHLRDVSPVKCSDCGAEEHCGYVLNDGMIVERAVAVTPDA